MIEEFLKERLHNSLLFMLLVDYCKRNSPEDPMFVVNAIMDNFIDTTSQELVKIIGIINDSQAGIPPSEPEIRSAVEEYVRQWREGLQHHIMTAPGAENDRD